MGFTLHSLCLALSRSVRVSTDKTDKIEGTGVAVRSGLAGNK